MPDKNKELMDKVKEALEKGEFVISEDPEIVVEPIGVPEGDPGKGGGAQVTIRFKTLPGEDLLEDLL